MSQPDSHDMPDGKKCNRCGAELTIENWHMSLRERPLYRCKDCFNSQARNLREKKRRHFQEILDMPDDEFLKKFYPYNKEEREEATA